VCGVWSCFKFTFTNLTASMVSGAINGKRFLP